MGRPRRYAQFLDEVVDALMIPGEPTWAGGGYKIRIRPTPAADGYSATVTSPSEAPEVRSFYVDDSGVIRWAVGETATADSSALEDDGDAGDVSPD